jgi:hypothetical protein
MLDRSNSWTSPGSRVALSLALPIFGALIFSFLVSRSLDFSNLILAGLGVFSLIIGVRWYGLPGMGLRGGRPLYAGIGFATLGWISFLVVRFLTVEFSAFGSPDSGNVFIFFLLFEAFAVQLWTFGLVFHSLADWRGPLTAAVFGGILFGAVALLLFLEPSTLAPSSLLYFPLWGVFYGVIRLRTGSLLGPVIVQALQSWTAWILLAPIQSIDTAQLRNLFLISSILYLIFIWRLWPKKEGDYRV